MGTHFFTSITANYLPKARVLAESIRKFYPSAVIHVVLSDRIPSWFAIESEPFDSLITPEDLSIPNLSSWLFQHDVVEVSTGVKGFALQRLLSIPDCEQVVYFDPDILVLSCLCGLLEHFHDASILLTPHLAEPEIEDSAVRDNELSTLQHGVFNLGFLGVKNSGEGRRFAQWWTDRLREFCFNEIPRGLFTDQRWADLIPAFFTDHKVLRSPVYNVATWNLSRRKVLGSLGQGLTIGGEPLVFYHFSGLDSGAQLGMLQRYGSDTSALFELRDWYLAECDRHGEAELNSLPWAYGCFSNGDPILKSQRRRYRDDLELQIRYPNPFQAEFDLQRVRPRPVEPSAAPTYRIFLIATPADEIYIDETWARLLQATVNKEQVWLVANRISRDIQSISVDALRYEDFAAHILQNFSDRDLILIRAGALPPPQWDLRLAWTAARQPSAVTISPLDRRTLDPAALLSTLDTVELDRLCYFYRQPDEQEVAFFSQDCVYVRSNALRSLMEGHKYPRLAHLLDDSARQHWQHLQATHLCLSFQCPLSMTAPSKPDRTLVDELRAHAFADGFHVPRTVTSTMNGATLHITHNWGGGVEQWIRNFGKADTSHEHLVLKSTRLKLQLYRYEDKEPELLQTWPLAPGVRATAIAHTEYRLILSELTAKFGVARIIVSSLIGHSLDCLQTQLPTLFVCHDYYPFCSAINITFGDTCRSCEPPRLQACLEENPFNRDFPNVAKDEWLALRAEFLKALVANNVTAIAPSHSVEANYKRLAPELASSFRVVPHGLRALPCQAPHDLSFSERRMRVLILGNLGLHKGGFLFESLLRDLLTFTELTLAGCRESGEPFAATPGIRVISEYEQENLPDLIADVRPDVGVFLSIAPETFSYTLNELQSMCVPPVATNVGSFADFIQEGETGFLCEPEPLSFLTRLRHLAANPSELASVRMRLHQRTPRKLEAMIEDYAALLPDQVSAERYFSGPHAPEALPKRALQLYWRRSGENFRENNSFVFTPFHEARQIARLYVPAGANPVVELRLDLGFEPGVLSLYRLSLFSKGGKRIWEFGDGRSLLQSAPHSQVSALSSTVLCLGGDDPHINLCLPEVVLSELSEGGFAEVDFACESLESRASEVVGGVDRGLLAEAEAAVLRRHNLELQEQQQALEALSQALQRSLSEADQELQLAQRNAEELRRLNQSFERSLSWHLLQPVRLAGKLGRKLTGRR